MVNEIPMLPNSAKHAFEPRRFSNRWNVELLRTTTTTDAYFSFSVSAYKADVKLYGLKIKKKNDFKNQSSIDQWRILCLLSSYETKIWINPSEISILLINITQTSNSIKNWIKKFNQWIYAICNTSCSNHFTFFFFF